MGSSMCGHLLGQGLRGHRLQPHQGARPSRCSTTGPRWADTPRAVAEASRRDLHASSAFPRDVREVFLGHRRRAGRLPRRAAILVDMTTSEPSLAVGDRRSAAKRKGVHSVDAPVSGGDVGAREARLSIMIGGDEDVVEALQPCWRGDGQDDRPPGRARRRPAHQDGQPDPRSPPNMIGVCEALLYGYKAGLDLNTVLQSVALGRGRQLVAVEPRPADHRQQLRARLLRRALHQGHGHRPGRSRSGWAWPCPAWRWPSSSTWPSQAQGHGRDGTHALELALASMSGIDWKNR